ncbi:MAG: dihydroorotate dehydrogenase electron transfer subunit [Planctomycetes bacterium]|nr:dihydroorotate dehydrogenase electron transfer subunit [Planctomycetota bacterium]
MDASVATILDNRAETPSVWRMSLDWDAISRGARAARFVMLSLEDRVAQLLPRPFSLSDVWRRADGTVVTELLYKPHGRVTQRMAKLRAGDHVHLGGLSGNGFPEPASGRRPVLLAGGIGNAPFALQVRELLLGAYAARASEVLLILAGRTAQDLWIQPAVRDAGITIIECTDDGSRGERGRITEVLERRLPQLGPIEAFVCGPQPMLHAVQSLALREGFYCHLSVEERMACGYGVCNACVVESVQSGVARGAGAYLRACVDGPVFEARCIHA